MQYPRKVLVLGMVSLASVGLMLTGPHPAEAGSYGMGSGMMGRGMMAPPSGNAEAPVNPARAEALQRYIQEEVPSCLRCHAVSRSSFGPSFAAIATNYADQADAEQILSQRIAHGIGRMPPGFATDAQAERLARLILDLQSQ